MGLLWTCAMKLQMHSNNWNNTLRNSCEYSVIMLSVFQTVMYQNAVYYDLQWSEFNFNSDINGIQNLLFRPSSFECTTHTWYHRNSLVVWIVCIEMVLGVTRVILWLTVFKTVRIIQLWKLSLCMTATAVMNTKQYMQNKQMFESNLSPYCIY